MGEDSTVTRRAFMASAAAAGAAAACSPAVAPSQPAALDGSTDEWERLVAAARKEGRVVVNTMAGPGYRKVMDDFQRAFPDIDLEHTSYTTASIWAPKVIQERQAGIYSWDVSQMPPNSALITLKPEGVWDPIRPAIIHPDALDDSKWRGGHNFGYIDEKEMAYAFELAFSGQIFINTDMVRPGELKSVKDLLDPRFTGRLIFTDVGTGFTFLPGAAMRRTLGDDFLRQLFVNQKPVYHRDPRFVSEQMIRGAYPVGILGTGSFFKEEFWPQGIGRNIRPINLPESSYIVERSVFLLNRAPHPNAAKVFINWLLTRPGQASYREHVFTNSRRTDVEPGEPELVVEPGGETKYFRAQIESTQDYIEDTRKFLESIVRV